MGSRSMFDIELTPKHEQVLREQVINAEAPGTILHDFQAVLDFVGTEGVKAGGKYHLLPIDAIPALDRRLARPLNLSLQRPQLRSHPYLEGLHLLLRTCGLGRVDGTGDKARLSLDPELLAVWQRLNPTEQYFNLLEAGLRFGRPEMVGERGRADFLMDYITIWDRVGARGQKLDPGHPYSRYSLAGELYVVALLDLFGLMRVEYPHEPVHPWLPACVQRAPFGEAVLPLLERWYFSDARYEVRDEPPHFGVWQPLFQPYFPEWCDNLALPEIAPTSGTFVFRVSLGKRVWREIAMPADRTLDDLAGWILHAFDFDYDHLYDFEFTNRIGATVCAVDPRGDGAVFADEVEMATLPLTPGQSMKFHYDFGDNWMFEVRLDRIEPVARIKKPRILAKHGKAPEQYPDAEW
jgi:hypothetical protein